MDQLPQFVRMLLIAAILLACLLLYSFLDDRIRRYRLRRFAAARGYTFAEQESTDVAPYYQNFGPWNLFRRYEVESVQNVIKGEIDDILFVYFEQNMQLAPGIYFGHPTGRYCLSVVALEISADRHFDVPVNGYKHFQVKRTGDFVYFQQRKSYLIKMRKLGRTLTEIVSLANASLAKPLVKTSE